MTEELSAEKRALRSTMKAVRADAFVRHGGQAGEKLAAHGLAFTGVSAPGWVSAFLSIGDEIDTLPLMARLAREGFGIALPVMLGKHQPLEFRAWRPGQALDEVQWGIKEPKAGARVVEPDVVLSPLLAFDDHGYRLGYGGGFYDRSLEKLRAKKVVITVGLAFDEQRVDAVPHDAYDQRLDWVLTPSGFRSFAKD